MTEETFKKAADLKDKIQTAQDRIKRLESMIPSPQRSIKMTMLDVMDYFSEDSAFLRKVSCCVVAELQALIRSEKDGIEKMIEEFGEI